MCSCIETWQKIDSLHKNSMLSRFSLQTTSQKAQEDISKSIFQNSPRGPAWTCAGHCDALPRSISGRTSRRSGPPPGSAAGGTGNGSARRRCSPRGPRYLSQAQRPRILYVDFEGAMMCHYIERCKLKSISNMALLVLLLIMAHMSHIITYANPLRRHNDTHQTPI